MHVADWTFSNCFSDLFVKNNMMLKGIVHPKMKIWCLSAYPEGIQDVGDFISSVEHKRRLLTRTVAVCQSYNFSQWDPRLWDTKKDIHRQNQIKPCGSWQYNEVLRHKTIGLCKKLNSIYIIYYLWFTCVHNIRHVTEILFSFLHRPIVSCLKTSMYRH